MAVTLNTFWWWARIFFGVTIAILAFAIWQSAQPEHSKPVFTQQEEVQALSAQTESLSKNTSLVATASEANLPAPAKKLHRLLNDTDLQPASNDTLEQRLVTLDQQLATINTELKAQGITVPQSAASSANKTDVANTDVQARLQVIKDYTSNKNNP